MDRWTFPVVALGSRFRVTSLHLRMSCLCVSLQNESGVLLRQMSGCSELQWWFLRDVGLEAVGSRPKAGASLKHEAAPLPEELRPAMNL